MSYNLLDEKWIPVLRMTGQYERVGIRTALLEASRIRQIAASNPMDRLAVLRFLLAMLYWCKGNPPSPDETVGGSLFPAEWFSRLNTSRNAFDLLGEKRRFYQYRKPGSGSDGTLSANYLVQEIPTGRNAWHFRHSTDSLDGLCLPCCAMGLLRLPVFATSGGRGKPPGVNSKPPIYAVPLGASLAETLRLSWRKVSNPGIPTWEATTELLPKVGEVPLLLGLTWVPRRVWLDEPSGSVDICISCGRPERLVRDTVFAPIGSVKTEEGGPGRVWRDPHVLYSMSREGETTPLCASDVLGNADSGASQRSRVATAILREQSAADALGQGSLGFRLGRPGGRFWIVGFSTVQNDKYLESSESVLCIGNPGTVSQPTESAHGIERWQKEGASLVRRVKENILIRRGKPKKNWNLSKDQNDVVPAVEAVRHHIEAAVSEHLNELAGGAEQDWTAAAEEYRPMMEMVGRSLSPGCTTAAVELRQRIANVVPNMRPRVEAAKQTRRKKGGNK